MEHQRDMHHIRNCPDSFKIQLWFEFVSSVGRPNGYGKGIRLCFLYKILCLGRICIVCFRHFRLPASCLLVIPHMSQFSLHSCTEAVGNLCKLRNLSHIFFIAVRGAVIHNRSESQLQRLHAFLKCKSVVIMDHNRD